MKFQVARDGEWLQPVRRGYLVKCCDCGLVHVVDIRLIKRKNGATTVQFRAKRVRQQMAMMKGSGRPQ